MKTLLKAKAFWTGVGSVVAGAALIFAEGKVTEGATLVVIGLSTIFTRNAIAKLQK